MSGPGRPPRAATYAGAGALLALGAPLGWLLLRAALGATPAAELRGQPLLYGYLTLGTALAFAAFGAGLGRLSDRLAAANAELERWALFDGLTGLRNARVFHADLERGCAEARRGGQPVALVMVDLDHFKRINDTHGHANGDKVLAGAAAALSRLARASDLAYRVGGEEFAVLCPGTDAAEAARVAERLRAALSERPLSLDGKEVPVSASFGVAALSADAAPEALFRAADGALYAAKQGGRNRVEVDRGSV